MHVQGSTFAVGNSIFKNVTMIIHTVGLLASSGLCFFGRFLIIVVAVPKKNIIYSLELQIVVVCMLFLDVL